MLLRVVKRGTKTLSYPHGHFQGSQQLLRTETTPAESEPKQQQKTKAKGWKGKERCCNLKPRSLTPFPTPGLPVACVDVERASNRKGKRGGKTSFSSRSSSSKKRHASQGSSITTLLHFFFVIKGGDYENKSSITENTEVALLMHFQYQYEAQMLISVFES